DLRALRLADDTTQLVESAIGNVVAQPVVAIGGDPLAADVVERTLQHPDEIDARKRFGAHELVANGVPALKNGGLAAAARDGLEQQGHLRAAHDHRPERAKRREDVAFRQPLVRPYPKMSPPAGLEVLAHAVAEDAVEVQGQDVGSRHVLTP